MSCQLGNGIPGATPALGVVLTGWRDVLFFAHAMSLYRQARRSSCIVVKPDLQSRRLWFIGCALNAS
jgi:hypothetical protein